MPGFGASDVLVHGRSRRGAALAVGLFVPIAAGFLCEWTDHGDLSGCVALLAAVEAIGFLFLPAIAPNGISFITGDRRGPLRADRDGVTFRKKTVLWRAQIRNVAIEALPGGAQIVHFSAVRERDEIGVEVEDDRRARALVDALELDTDKHVSTFSVEEDPLRSRARWFAARALIAAGALALAAGVLYLARREELYLIALVPVLLVYALLLPRARVRTDVVLAADGLMLRHRGVERSIPLSSIAEVRRAKNEATLVLRSGEELVLRFGGEQDERASLQHAAFGERMREANLRRDRPHDPAEALLARGGREASEWTRHLLDLGRASEGYRVATVHDESLWRIAEGTVAEPSARVGALVALRSRLDHDARCRLQALAERTAQRDLKAALEAAAEGAEAEAIILAYERGSRS